MSGDVESQPGTNYITVVGLQHQPIEGIVPVNGDILMFQAPFGSPASPALNEWVPTPWGIRKIYVAPVMAGSPLVETLIVDASEGNSFYIHVTAAIAAMEIISPQDGQEITLLWVQDGTGHAITLASNLKGATAPSTGANTVSCQKFSYDLTSNNWYAVAAGVTGL